MESKGHHACDSSVCPPPLGERHDHTTESRRLSQAPPRTSMRGMVLADRASQSGPGSMPAPGTEMNLGARPSTDDLGGIVVCDPRRPFPVVNRRVRV